MASEFRKGKADVLRVVPDAVCHGSHYKGKWIVESATLGELTDNLSSNTTPQAAWADAYDTLRMLHPKIIRVADQMKRECQ